MQRQMYLVVSIVLGLVAFSLEVQAGPCSSKFNCKDCKDNGVGQYECKDVKYDSYCTCTTYPNPHISCELHDICDYTGPPACENPTPAGECPNNNFGFVAEPLNDTVQDISNKEDSPSEEADESCATPDKE